MSEETILICDLIEKLRALKMDPKTEQAVMSLIMMIAEEIRRGEERGFKAARTVFEKGQEMEILHCRGLDWKYPLIGDWRASEEYKKGIGSV